MTQIKPNPQRFLFALSIISIIISIISFHYILSTFLERSRIVTLSQSKAILSDSILAMAGQFNRQNWFQNKSAPIWKKYVGLPFNERIVTSLAKEFSREFPHSQVYGFEERGNIVFPKDVEAKRSREILWKGITATMGRGGAIDFEVKSRINASLPFCKSLFGSFVHPSDLSDHKGIPRIFLNKGKRFFSLVLPQHLLNDNSPPGIGGVWILIDPAKLPSSKIARSALYHCPKEIDLALVVKNEAGKPKVEAFRGKHKLHRSVVAKFFNGETENIDDSGLWMSSYIPAERGRYLIAGVRRERIESVFSRFRGSFEFAFALICGLFCIPIFKIWWIGIPLNLGVRAKIAVLIFFISVVPMIGMITVGLNRIDEAQRFERNAWEERIFSALSSIDTSYQAFQQKKILEFEKIERDLFESRSKNPFDESSFSKFFAEMKNLELFYKDSSGPEFFSSNGISVLQYLGEILNWWRLSLARKLDLDENLRLASRTTFLSMLSPFELEKGLQSIISEQGKLSKIRINGKPLLHRFAFLNSEGGKPLGLLCWIFDEVEFAKSFIESTLKQFFEGKFGRFELAVVSDFGDVFPRTSRNLKILEKIGIRSGTWNAKEAKIIEIQGNEWLMCTLVPRFLGGYRLIGLIETAILKKESNLASFILGFFFLFSVFLLLFSIIWLSNGIIRPIKKLLRFVQEISNKNYDFKIEETGNDELGQLAKTFNSMAQGLLSREKARAFVSKEVWNEVKKEDRFSLALGGEHRETAILFSHIFNFNEVFDKLPLPESVEFLSDFFDQLNLAFFLQNGELDKCIGEVAMGVFHLIPGEVHPAKRAVSAAFDLRHRLETLNENRLNSGRVPVRVDFGIHFGKVISGKVGSLDGRIDFTVIGDVVNTASRISSFGENLPKTCILISKEVKEQIGPGTKVREWEGVRLKGKSESCVLFECLRDQEI
ncbi:adenylate/guanylate cyclase domain-containing protein [bacterium]|nr:adenylate/guanylate cyclase domain-containing protein [bacterium]